MLSQCFTVFKLSGSRLRFSGSRLPTLFLSLQANKLKTVTFDELNLTKPLLNAIADVGYENPTPIQVKAFPVIMLFRNIQAIKELEGKFEAITPEQKEALAAFINLFDKQDLTPIRSNFLTIWEVLGSIYQEFKSLLENKKLAYEGMAYRAAAEKFDGENTIKLPDGLFAFIGFNALNGCEKALFRYFKREDRALFYWDYDTYYTQDEVQEAGTFIRANLKEFPNAIAASNFSNFKEKRKLTVINTPTGVAQAKLVPIAQLGRSHHILPAEDLLLDFRIFLHQLQDLLPDAHEHIQLFVGPALQQHCRTMELIRYIFNQKLIGLPGFLGRHHGSKSNAQRPFTAVFSGCQGGIRCSLLAPGKIDFPLGCITACAQQQQDYQHQQKRRKLLYHL